MSGRALLPCSVRPLTSFGRSKSSTLAKSLVASCRFPGAADPLDRRTVRERVNDGQNARLNQCWLLIDTARCLDPAIGNSNFSGAGD